MQKKKNIALFVPDGTGIKNYLYSDIFKNANVQLTLLHNFDEDTLAEIKKHIHLSAEIKLPDYKETVKEKFLREVIHAARIHYNIQKTGNKTIAEFKKTTFKTLKLKAFYRAVELYARRITSYKKIEKLEAKYDSVVQENPCFKDATAVLKSANITSLFCTHQRAIKAGPYFLAAKKLDIQTLTVIYSWDNLPKARLALRADKYLVWSSLMKKQLELFYPDIKEHKILITGTPQFEFYADTKNIIPKDVFYNTYGLDPAKKIICFSGDDEHTSPNDPVYLDDLATNISESTKSSEYQIVFRRCPVDVSGRYNWVLKKFPDLIIDMPPQWNFNSAIWTAVYPLFEDVKLLVSLAYYADVVINLGSTMAFDFAMFNKPCIYIAYDPVKNPKTSVKTIYGFEHFTSMPSKDVVFWLKSPSQILQILDRIDQNEHTTVNEWMSKVAEYSNRASANIKKLLEI